MKLRILVTGANGQLGKALQEVYTTKYKTKYDITFASKEVLDITSAEKVNTFISKYQFDYCINCAAYTAVDKAEEEPELAHLINTEAVKHLAVACKANDILLIHISTDYVFDGLKTVPYKEDDETIPINVYGKSKLAGEHFIQDILDNYFIIRTSWLYSKYNKNFVKTISKKISENANLKVVTSERGTPTNCTDLSAFIFHLIETNNEKYGIYHFSNLGDTTWYDFAREIARYFPDYNLNKLQAVATFKTLAKRPKYSVMNKSKVETSGFRIPHWTDSLKIVMN